MTQIEPLSTFENFRVELIKIFIFIKILLFFERKFHLLSYAILTLKTHDLHYKFCFHLASLIGS